MSSPMGGRGMMGGGMGGGMGGQGQMRPEFLTCISKDQQDPSSQVRLTLTRSMRNNMGGRRMGGGMMGGPMMGSPFGDDMDMDMDLDDDLAEFRVDGTFVPGMSANKAGTYRVVITQFGRIADGCSAQSLGPVLSQHHIRRRPSRMGGMMGGMPGGMGAGFGVPGMGMGSGMMGPYSRFGRNFCREATRTEDPWASSRPPPLSAPPPPSTPTTSRTCPLTTCSAGASPCAEACRTASVWATSPTAAPCRGTPSPPWRWQSTGWAAWMTTTSTA